MCYTGKKKIIRDTSHAAEGNIHIETIISSWLTWKPEISTRLF